jgi:hypothetical protein
LPNLDNPEEMIDIITLCALFETGNALQNWPSFDDKRTSKQEKLEASKLRQFLIRGRKRARELVEWINATYEFTSGKKYLPFKSKIYEPYVAKFAACIYRYRCQVDLNNNDFCQPDEVLEILSRSFANERSSNVSRQFEDHVSPESETGMYLV